MQGWVTPPSLTVVQIDPYTSTIKTLPNLIEGYMLINKARSRFLVCFYTRNSAPWVNNTYTRNSVPWVNNTYYRLCLFVCVFVGQVFPKFCGRSRAGFPRNVTFFQARNSLHVSGKKFTPRKRQEIT